MQRLDRYVLIQLIGPMGFFAVVFVGLIWLTQSLRIVEIVVRNNQSGLVFLELSALLLPGVIATILPIAAFAATLFVINRLYGESELVVMMAAGRSHVALARPVAMFGMLMVAATAALTLYLTPASTAELRQRTADLRAEVTNALLQGGRFVTPQDGITVFVREASRDGRLLDVFIHDQRNRTQRVTYTAQVARLTRQGDEAQMVMVNGTTQRYNLATGELSVLDFERLVYDLGTIVRSTEDRRRAAGEFYFYELINPAETLRINNPRQYGAFIAEGHDQLSSPLYALALPLMALAGLLAGGFRRGGFAGRIGIVVAAAVLGRVAGVAVKAQVAADPTLWPSLYAVPGALILGSLALLILSGRARSPRRARVFAEGNPG